MPEPKQIGLTIDAAISELNKLLICDVVSSLPTSKDRISELEKAIGKYIDIAKSKACNSTQNHLL